MSKKKLAVILLYSLIFLNIFFLSANISFQIMIGGEMVSLPDLAGLTFEEAKTELMNKKLAIAQSGVRLHDEYEKGRIIMQEPSAGSRLKLYKVVRVVLSAGKEKVIVPKLTGRMVQPINIILDEGGLKRGKISHVHTGQYAAGKIIAQNPLPEDEVAINTRISLLVSQGSQTNKYLMPDLIGKRASSIIQRLKELDFRVADVRYVYYPGIGSGLIIKQYPEQGFPIQKRSPINLEVSK
jgi:serine/threonine-protein kinase